MISGFGIHGQAKNAVAFFHRMEDKGFIPNEVTFLAVLSACSHGGLVTEGTSIFESMVRDYGLTPKAEHYGSCRVHGNVCLGESVKRVLEEIYDEHPADSIILSSTYAIAGWLPNNMSVWEMKGGERIREDECRVIGIKEAGCSTIEVESQGR
ncbi:Pentatricopeptide repeat-containing protein [Camellia lanceoleosa]|uniref:Pentatricopeptide repeat-containing protein n=1 Tax=Camellia lanceoleosa TaxID=1840588 RepID=A0ACC0I5P4_9ERIC|nr:Pentatricopeptide repeat-containing protein [Camellia lanceoleosa]